MEAIAADVAMVFHWPPEVLMEMNLDELLVWHREARARASMLFR